MSEESFYHRRKSSSQTAEVARMQIASQEMWGGSQKNTVSSDPPVVKAYMGKIPRETYKGIEFTTYVKTDSYHPVWASWSEREGIREGVWMEDWYAKIRVCTTFCNQLDDPDILELVRFEEVTPTLLPVAYFNGHLELVKFEEVTPTLLPVAYFDGHLADLINHLKLPIYGGYNDLDEMNFAFITLPSGKTVVIGEYSNAPRTGVDLYVDSNQVDIPAVVYESCQQLGKSRNQVVWFSEKFQVEIDQLFMEQGDIQEIKKSTEIWIQKVIYSPIACLQHALKIYDQANFPEYWAMLQYNLGTAYYQNFKGGACVENLKLAINHYLQSEKIHTQGKNPERWIIIQNSLEIVRDLLCKNLVSTHLSRPLFEREKLVISSIVKKIPYRQISVQSQYTESSLQNVASRLFHKLSQILGVSIHRRNFVEQIEKEIFKIATKSITFDRIEANDVIEKAPENTTKILSLIKYIYNNGYKNRFNPRIYKRLGIEVDERQWIEVISTLVRSRQATEKFELICPNCHEIINSYIKYQNIPLDQAIRCIHCNHEFEVSEENIVPMYSFSESFDPTQDLSIPRQYSDILAKND